MLRTLILTIALTFPALALAGQGTPAADFDGAYDLEVTSAAINLHIGLAITTPTGGGAWGNGITVPLDPDGVSDDEAEALEAELLAQCEPTVLPEELCADLAILIVDAVVDFNNAVVYVLPEAAELTVGSFGWISKIFGLYPAAGTHQPVVGDPYDIAYLLNNNDDVHHGDLLSGGFGIAGFGGGQGWLCADAGVALAAAQIDQPDGFSVEAGFIVDRELLCAAVLGEGVGVAGTIGLAFGGTLIGSK
jgi:hypothetical protein